MATLNPLKINVLVHSAFAPPASGNVAHQMAIAPLRASFNEQLAAFFTQARELSAGGLTLAEVGHLFGALIHLGVGQAAELDLLGNEKKALVVAAVAQLYDLVAPAIPLPVWIAWLRPYLRPAIRSAVLAVADGVIESVWAALKNTLPQPEPVPEPAPAST